MSGVVSGTTRALACLALGHEDTNEPRCSSTDEDLVAQLVEEVQALRVAAGIVEESEADRQAQEAAVAEALLATADDSGWSSGADVLAALREDGWTLHPIRRPRL